MSKSSGPKPKRVLDACALIALLKLEEGWEVVRDLLNQANEGEIDLYITVVNLVEVLYDRIRAGGVENADAIVRRIYALPVTVIYGFDALIANDAALLKVPGKMSLADTFLVATAAHTGAAVVTSDWAELEAVAEQGRVPFLWIRPRPRKP